MKVSCTWFRTRALTALALTSVAALAACDTDSAVTDAPDDVVASVVADVAQSQAAVDWVPVANFEASYDPDGAGFQIEMLDIDAWDPADAERFRQAEQSLFCPVRVTNGAANTVVLSTDPGTIFSDVVSCGFPAEFPYTTLGAFCADVAAEPRGFDLTEAYAQITSMTPNVGYNGYQFPFGNGVDPSTISASPNQPNGAAGGLFAYGDILGGTTGVSQWMFENAGGAFSFRGRIVAAFSETQNGFDDDCDGRIDEATNSYADGAECVDDVDCVSNVCTAGLCAATGAPCDPGFYGGLCDMECPGGAATPCSNQGTCDDGLTGLGTCACDPGFGGADCSICLDDSDGDGEPDCTDLCPADPAKVAPGTCGCGTADVDGDGDGTPDCNDLCPADPAKIAAGDCGCGVADTDGDGDGTADCIDLCPADPVKTDPGDCGCGVADTDGDGDGTADCIDLCPADPAKIAAGVCGCGVSDIDGDGDGTPDCNDLCPADPAKTAAGVCGCGVSDVDGDGDGTPDCNDFCPADPAKTAAGLCGCGVSDVDGDGDGTPDCNDFCPADPAKIAAGDCGCGVADTDGDGDGTADCIDLCPADPGKIAAGDCGCGVADIDGDGDGTADCIDLCPADPGKIAAGICGCGVSDIDGDGDGTPDCNDLCPADPAKTAAGVCGCGVSDVDGDGDGTPDCNDLCPADPAKTAAGVCGCGVSDVDGDGDGTPDCNDLCPADPAKTAAGVCGCGVSDVDGDGDGTPDCNDLCPADPAKTAPGQCGCGVADTDGDGDGTADCNDLCPADPLKTAPGTCGCGVVDSPGCGAAPVCGDGFVNDSAIPAGATVSVTGLQCDGSAGTDFELTLSVNGTDIGTFDGPASCTFGLAPVRYRVDAQLLADELVVGGPNSIRLRDNNVSGNGVYWAKIRFDGSAETFVIREVNAGDALTENLQNSGSVEPTLDTTITPAITLFAVEDCDDGNSINGDGCSNDCSSEVGGYCGDNNVATPQVLDVSQLTYRFSAANCTGAPFDVVFSINGVDVLTHNTNAGCVCGPIGQVVVLDDPALLAGLRANANNTFGVRTVPGPGIELAWAKVVNDDTGLEQVIYEYTAGAGAAQSNQPCGTIATSIDAVVSSALGVSSDEACDDGNATDGDGCDSNCTITGCGNLVVTAGETCDEGTETLTCDFNCTAVSCGDGDLNATAGEECDDGNAVDGDGCSSACVLETCGDGVVQTSRGETCDDGNLTDGDGCASTCTDECGDGALASSGAVTSATFEFHGESWQGESTVTVTVDGYVIFTTTIDDVFNGNEPVRSFAITDPYALYLLSSGPRAIALRMGAFQFSNSAIELDWARLMLNGVDEVILYDPNGNAGSPATSMAGAVDVELVRVTTNREACDDGNLVNGDGCSATCATEGCGNGLVEAGEECDDGNTTAGDGCSATCTLPTCGDGALDLYEDCDDGGTVGGDGCSAVCRDEVCGNGTLDAGEACDDANLVGGDGCSATCAIESCGNGTVDVGEGCDGGAGCSAGCLITGCVPGTDTDGDRLDDCVETNTGIFVSASDTGTDPNVADSDGDAIDDGDEVLGTLGGLDLPLLGANPNRKTIFVEFDWTLAPGCSFADFAPAQWEMDLSIDVFKQAPVSNRDGSRGIDLVIDYGQGAPFTAGNELPGNDDFLDDGLNSEFLAYKAANFASNRADYFHYAIQARSQGNGAGGLGEAPGDDFNLTQGCNEASMTRVNTFIHELGHNLGLLHGGGDSCNDRPNYNSIMNYSSSGDDSDCNGTSDGLPNFSTGSNVSIDENNINEFAGVCGDVPVDFDSSGGFNSGYSLNLNPHTGEAGNCGGTLTTLDDYNDWANLVFTGPLSSSDTGIRPQIVVCEPPNAAFTP